MIRRFHKLLALGLILACAGCATVNAPKIGGRAVSCPASIALEAQAAHDLAVARLSAVGQPLRGHTIKAIALQAGTVHRPKGWAVPDSNSPTGYAGAYSTGSRIVIITAPDGSQPNTGALAHEWAENLLLRAEVWSQEERHKIIKKAGL